MNNQQETKSTGYGNRMAGGMAVGIAIGAGIGYALPQRDKDDNDGR